MFNFEDLLYLIPIPLVALVIWGAVRARRQPLWAEAYRRLARNRLTIAALCVIAVYASIGVLDSIGWRDDRNAEYRTLLDRAMGPPPAEKTYSAPLASMTTGEPRPSPLRARHILGTDGSGGDVLYLTLKGCRTALFLGGLTTLLATPIALLFGMLAGYFGRRVDDAIQYLYTVVGSIPSILLLIALMMVMGRGLLQLCFALGITSWVSLCRLSRAETLKHRDRDYVRGARALGLSHGRILVRHILPNLLPVVIISVTLGLSNLVLAEAILSYLQLGVPPGVGSWGNMIDAARLELARQPIIWWNLAAASFALFLFVLACNIIGDALRDAIDPRLRTA